MPNKFFNEHNMLERLVAVLPPGRIFKNAFRTGTNMNALLKWISTGFEWLIQKTNYYFKGIFLQEGDAFLEKYKAQYGIPRPRFDSDTYSLQRAENHIDVFVLKYLCINNTKKGLQMLWNAYGVRVRVENEGTGIIKIIRYATIGDRLPHKLPFYFGLQNTFEKLEHLTKLVIPAHVIYRGELAPAEYITEYKKDPLELDFIAIKIAGEKIEKIVPEYGQDID